MPIYEFQCRKCGAEFELLMRLSDGADTVSCPACESGDVVRLLSICTGGSGSRERSGSTCRAPSSGFG